jgi:thioester reductase-like protein
MRSTRALIDFSLSSELASPPSILFTSSVGVLRGVDVAFRWSFSLKLHLGAHGPYLETLSDPADAQASGYTESKWCAEQILAQASAKTPVKTAIVRIGQVCGGRSGYFDSSQWVGALVKSSIKIKALPAMSSVSIILSLTYVVLTMNALSGGCMDTYGYGSGGAS